MIKNYSIFASNFFNLKNILALRIFENTVVYRFSIFNAPCHDALLLEISYMPLSKKLKLLMLIGGIPSPLFFPTPIFRMIPVPLSRLVIYVVMLLMVLGGFIGMPLFVFHPESILILSKKSTSGGEVMIAVSPSINGSACLVSVNNFFVQTRSTIVISKNRTCSTLVRLLFFNWYIINFLEVYSLSGEESDGFHGRLLR